MPYGSLKTNDERRVSKEGDFSRVSKYVEGRGARMQSNKNDTGSFNNSRQAKQYYEPKVENFQRKRFVDERAGINENMFTSRYRTDGSDKINISDGDTQGQNYQEDPQLPRPTPKKAKKKAKKNKFLHPNTFFDRSSPINEDDLTLARLSNHVMNDDINGFTPNDSMSSTNSVNKSLKMAQRKEKKRAKVTSNYPPLDPNNSGGYQHLRTFNR